MNANTLKPEESQPVASTALVTLPDARLRELRDKATTLVESLLAASDNRELAKSLEVIGQKTQVSVTRFATRKVGDLAKIPGSPRNAKIGEDLTHLRLMLSVLDSNNVGPLFRYLGWLPLIGGWLRGRVLTGIYTHCQSVKQNVDAVCERLESLAGELQEDNTSLDDFDRQLEDAATEVKANESLAVMVVEELKGRLDTAVPQQRVRLENLLANIAGRGQSLAKTELIVFQGRVSASQIQQANVHLMAAINEAVYTGRMALETGFAIRFALDTERKAIAGLRATGKVVDTMIKGNAEMLEQQAGEATELRAQGVVSMDALRQANASLVNAVRITQEANRVVVTTAAQNIKELRVMADEMERALPAKEGEQQEIASVEA